MHPARPVTNALHPTSPGTHYRTQHTCTTTAPGTALFFGTRHHTRRYLCTRNVNHPVRTTAPDTTQHYPIQHRHARPHPAPLATTTLVTTRHCRVRYNSALIRPARPPCQWTALPHPLPPETSAPGTTGECMRYHPARTRANGTTLHQCTRPVHRTLPTVCTLHCTTPVHQPDAALFHIVGLADFITPVLFPCNK